MKHLHGILGIGLIAALISIKECSDTKESIINVEVNEGTQLKFDISYVDSTIVFDIWGQLWTLPLGGGEATPITDAVADTADDTDPCISPDGTFIVFKSDRPEGTGLYKIDLPEARISKITEGRDSEPVISPDGKKLAFVRGWKIGIYDFLDHSEEILDVEGVPSPYLNSPSWIPGEKSIMFVSARTFWSVSENGGVAKSLSGKKLLGYSPCSNSAGSKLAFFASDTSGNIQLFVAHSDGTNQIQLTNHKDVFSANVHWTPDDHGLLYSADGKLWKVSLDTNESEQIPFSAKLSIKRKKYEQNKLTFPDFEESIYARGHMGLSIAPDGNSAAMFALNKLWLIPFEGKPKELISLPFGAAGLTWHPDGSHITWSAGLGGAENLFLTDITNGTTQQITDLPGQETQPSWSSDGKLLAFAYWEKAVLSTDPWLYDDSFASIRVVASDSLPIRKVANTTDLGALPGGWNFRFFGYGQEIPQWKSDAKSLLLVHDKSQLVSLDGVVSAIDSFPENATYVNWSSESWVYYIFNDQALKVFWDTTKNEFGEPIMISEAPAQYLSVSNDGTSLFLSSDGLHLVTPDLSEEVIGWPIQFKTPSVPKSILIQNATILDGSKGMQSTLGDILIKNGRIKKIAKPNTIKVRNIFTVIDATGKTVIPGLINLHEHIWDNMVVPGLLYHGITTMREMGSPLARVAGLRDAVSAGAIPGPRIIFGGWQFWGNEGFGGETGHAPDNTDGISRAMEFLAGQGADYLKVRMFSNWTQAVKLIDNAHLKGWPTSGHISMPLPLVAAGVDGMEHLGPSGIRTDKVLYSDMMQLMKECNIWVVPTAIGYSSSVRFADDPELLDSAFISPWMRWWGLRLPPSYRPGYDRFAKITREEASKLNNYGVTIGAGSDAPSAPYSLHLELEELVSAGMTSSDVIASATSIAAKILGADNEIGIIAEGMRADILILNADPIENISNTQKINTIIFNGEVVNRDSILTWWNNYSLIQL